MKTPTFHKTLITILCGLVLFSSGAFAQTNMRDTLKIPYGKIYGYALQGTIKPALALLEPDTSKVIRPKDKAFITTFKQRFSYADDQSNYLAERKSKLDSLLKLFRDYWRLSLLDDAHNYDTLLTARLSEFFRQRYPINSLARFLDKDTLDQYLSRYVQSAGFHTNGFGKVGKYYDLLVWRTQKDTTYQFNILDEKIKAPVVFMDDFLSLGWEEYATLGMYYPGGWTTSKAIYSVKKAYDLKSDAFLIDLLAHEGRHFADKQLFPKLSGADLEYRAKLVQLSLHKKSIYQSIQFFINEADSSSNTNPHPFADYCLIRDLSRILFKTAFEKDIAKWKARSPEEINTAAQQLLQETTKTLRNQVDIEHSIHK